MWSSPSGSVLGFPRAEEWNLIPAWTTAGKARYLKGGIRPVLVFSEDDSGVARKVLSEFHPGRVVPGCRRRGLDDPKALTAS